MFFLGSLWGTALGDNPGEMGDALPYIPLGSGVQVKAVSAGDDMVCAVLRDAGNVGRVKCFGMNDAGRLGLGDTVDRFSLGALGDALPFVNLGTGRSISYVGVHLTGGCALDEASSSVLCWGAAPQHGLDVWDAYGDNATRMGDALPVVNLGTGAVVKALSVGYERSCAILDTATVTGGVKCWVSSPRAPFGCTTVALSRD